MECCGQDRMTKFCPDCGTPLTGDPLVALMQYVNMHARHQQDRVVKAERVPDDKYEIRLAKRNAAKWQAWADELEKAIAALAEKEKVNDPENDNP